MQTARRLYVYLMTGIGLGVLVYGLVTLLTVLLEQIGLGAAAVPVFGGEETTRQQLTLSFALISVSLPVWLIHWFLAERSLRPAAAAAELERNSVIRGLYFAIAMGLLLFVAATGASSLVETSVLAIVGGDASFRHPASDVAMFLVAGAAWVYHVLIRNRDWKVGSIEGAAAFLPRVYLYGAAFVGLIALISGINGLIELVGRVVLDEPPAFAEGGIGPWWGFPLASAVAAVVVGGGVWLGHSLYAERLRSDAGWRGSSERPAKVRLAYFVAVILASAAAVIFFIAESGRGLLGAVLGVSDGTGTAQQAGLVLLPALSAIAFALAWLLHRGRMRSEASTLGSPDRLHTAQRLALYAPALVGLAYASVGVAWLLRLLIDAALGGGNLLAGTAFAERELARYLPLALVGTAVWLWAWNGVGVRYRQAPADEAAATTRRVSLLLVLAGGILAGIASLGVILYRLFGSLFGIEAPSNVIEELSLPIGSLIVSAAVATYHGLALRRDQALRVEPAAPAHETTASAPALVVLRLLAPPGIDAAAAVAAMRSALPAGFVLDVMPPAPTSPEVGDEQSRDDGRLGSVE